MYSMSTSFNDVKWKHCLHPLEWYVTINEVVTHPWKQWIQNWNTVMKSNRWCSDTDPDGMVKQASRFWLVVQSIVCQIQAILIWIQIRLFTLIPLQQQGTTICTCNSKALVILPILGTSLVIGIGVVFCYRLRLNLEWVPRIFNFTHPNISR